MNEKNYSVLMYMRFVITLSGNIHDGLHIVFERRINKNESLFVRLYTPNRVVMYTERNYDFYRFITDEFFENDYQLYRIVKETINELK